jgi:hypothetical protein
LAENRLSNFQNQQNGTLFSNQDFIQAPQAASNQPNKSSPFNNINYLFQQHSLYMDTAKLLVSLIQAWDLDENVNRICIENLKLSRPKIPLSFGTISKSILFSLVF